ncbi:MAG: hypothetical protein ACKOFW_14530, partial [Planctomycetaceae bacterium]
MLRLLALCQLPPVRRGAPREEAARPAGGRPRLWLALWLTCGVWAGLPGGLAAELLPAEVGVLASDKGRESGQLARYYMQARGIPAENLLLLDVPAGEALSRDLWDRRVRPAIRKWLLSRDRTRPIRCLVTMYDVPLRIGGLPKEAPALRESEQFLESATQKCRAEVVATAEALERVLNDEPQTLATPAADASPADLGKYLDGPLQRALVRIQERARSEPNSPAVPSAMRRLELLHMTAAGLSGSLRQLESQAPAGAPQQAERARLMAHRQGELQGLKLGVTALSFQPESVTREMQLLELITRADGLLVALSWATQQLEVVRKNETQASFDSELALVLWPDHGLVRWLPNPLHWSTARLPAARPDTLMVARLDGPTPEIVRR